MRLKICLPAASSGARSCVGAERRVWHHRLRALLLSAGLLSSAAAKAQPGLGLGDVQVLSPSVSVRAWTVENGLPQSSVTELLRDGDGYVWGATFGGLFRFDGRSVRRFTSADLPVLSGNSVTALATSPDGHLLVGTPHGTILRLLDGRYTDTLTAGPADGHGVAVDALLATTRGELWVRRADDVQRVVGGRWEPRLPWKGATALVREASGRLYYGGPSGIVQVGRDGSASLVSPVPKLNLGQAYGFHVDARGRLWIGGADGLWLYEDGKGAQRVAGTRGVVNCIVTDSAGTVWFGADEQLYRYSLDGAEPDSVPQAVLNVRARLNSLAMTADGLLVLGTLEGMLLIRQNAILVLESRRAIPGVETGSLASTGDGTIWVTSSCSDALRIDRNANVIDSLARPNPLGCTRSLAFDEGGRLWAGGDGAIRRRNRDGSERVWVVDSLTPDQAFVRPLVTSGDSLLFGVSDGRVGTIGADGGLRFLPGWRERSELPIESMAIGEDAALWVGQTGRVTRMLRGRAQRFGATSNVPNAIPRALYPQPNGAMLIGTYGAGLWYFRPGTMARSVPVADQTVSAIIEGPGERLWMPGNRGLTVLSTSALREWVLDSARVPDLRLLSYEEGVPEGNMGSPAAAHLAPGILAFSSVTGLVVVHTWGVVTGGITPRVKVEEIHTSAGRLWPEGGVLRVEPRHRGLYATASMPSFRFGEVAQFRYRLRDDQSWVLLGNARQLQFTFTEPGRYSLTVEGRVPGGEWVRATPVALEVVALFSERLWPRVLIIMIVVALAAAVVRQRVRATQATARSREEALQARREMAESAEQHQREMAQFGRVAVAGELTASLSHELGQPLAAIVNNAEVARRLIARQSGAGGVNPAVEQALLDVVAQGRRASQVVREFRRFLRRELGERELLGVHELIDSTTLLLRQEFDESRVTLHVEVYPETPPLRVERVLLQQVLVNLLQNAHEAARQSANGRVLVRARHVAGGVRLTVVDTGEGFSPDVRHSAFEPFVTTRANGMGMGLAIARRVIESHGGHIAVGRLPSAGAVVSLWLPAQGSPAERTDSLIPLQVTSDG